MPDDPVNPTIPVKPQDSTPPPAVEDEQISAFRTDHPTFISRSPRSSGIARGTARVVWLLGAVACFIVPAALFLRGPNPANSLLVFPVGIGELVGVCYCLYRAFRSRR
jgi:hypothetical protein